MLLVQEPKFDHRHERCVTGRGRGRTENGQRDQENRCSSEPIVRVLSSLISPTYLHRQQRPMHRIKLFLTLVAIINSVLVQ
jgi:hypothetical protein